MRTGRIVLVAVLVLGLVTLVWAAKSTPLAATFLPNQSSTSFGVSDDGNPSYTNNVGGVRVYFGVNNGNANLVTYSTGRKLDFLFDPDSGAANAAGLTAASGVSAEVDFYGINYYGQFQSMGIGTTAQMKGSLQFKANNTTYELLYQSLAVKRMSATTWLITTDPFDPGGNPGFSASDQAELSSFRRRTRTVYGAVNMPMRFEVTTQL